MNAVGKVIQVAGPAVDVEFLEGQIPVIRTAIRITSEGFTISQLASRRLSAASALALDRA